MPQGLCIFKKQHASYSKLTHPTIDVYTFILTVSNKEEKKERDRCN
jgi:hypothetical protein